MTPLARSRGLALNPLKGFTLIELLVVIAIIGILSAIVMASLTYARSKGNDSAIKSNLNSVRDESAIFYDQAQSYGTFDDGSGNPTACPAPGAADASVFGNSTIENAVAAAVAASNGGSALCYTDPSNYAVAITRPTSPAAPSLYWCVDSTGISCGNDGGGSSAPISGGMCIACTTNQ